MIDSVALLENLTQAHAVSGYEGEVRDLFRENLESVGAIKQDRLGSVVCDLGGSGKRLLIAGHMDEVGFRIQNITSEGFLRIVNVGGWWTHNLLAQRVEVKTRGGQKFIGVIGSKPPHFLPESERRKVMTLENLFVDLGASSREEVEEWGIQLGDPICPVGPWTPLAKEGRYMAKAFDNRVGMAAAIESGLRLEKEPRKNHLFVAGTVQEEVGLRGAKTLSQLVKPDVALILEGPPAEDTPGFVLSESQGTLGQGVQIRLHDPTAIMDPDLVDFVKGVALEEGIPHQMAVRRSGGTDAGSFHVSDTGVPSIVLGVPSRYIHSHHSVMDIIDYRAMVDLVVAVAKKLD